MKVRKGIAGVTVALAVTVSGLGSSAAYASGQDENQDLTSRATLTATVSGAPGQEAPVTVTVDGAINYNSLQGEFTLNQSGGPETPATQLIVDGTSVYTQVPAEALAQTGGKHWIKTDAAEMTKSLGIDMNLLSQTENPMSGDPIYVGKDRVHNVKTKHYQVSIVSPLYGSEPLTADVWIDRHDRVRKVSIDIDLSKVQLPAGSTEPITGSLNVTAEFYEFGTDVDVQAPAAEDTITLAELAAVQPAVPAAA